jgi:hypothetical protein
MSVMGITMTPGGDRAIVVFSDEENKPNPLPINNSNVAHTFERRRSLEEPAASEISAPNDQTVQYQRPTKLLGFCCRECSRAFAKSGRVSITLLIDF